MITIETVNFGVHEIDAAVKGFALAAPYLAAVILQFKDNIRILSAEVIGKKRSEEEEEDPGLLITKVGNGKQEIIAPDDSLTEIIFQRDYDRHPRTIYVECEHDGVSNFVTEGKVNERIWDKFRFVGILGGVQAKAKSNYF